MFEYLRRLATTGAAYTASSVLSKLIAVALLPVYTAALTPADYGAAEVVLASVIALSIIVRLGLIEALLRFYYLPDVDRPEVVRTGFAALFWSTTAIAAICLVFAAPISQLLLDHTDAELGRLAVLGLWTLTLWEYALTLLRVDERARAYFWLTVLNVVATIPVTVYLVVVADEGAAGILWGTFGTGLAFLAWLLWRERRRLSLRFDVPLLRRMTRFGLPTMPAELTLYSLNFIDRILIVRLAGLAEAGCTRWRSSSPGMNVIARAFQLAWPPLAYSIADDDEARRAYASCSPGSPRSAPSPSPGSGCWRGGSSTCWRRPPSSVLQGGGPAGDRDRALRALPRPGRDPGAHRANRVQPAGDDRGHRRQRRREPGLIPRWGSSARGSRSSRRSRRAGAHVRAHAAPLPGAVRVGPAGAPVVVTAATVAGGELLLPTSGFGGFASRLVLWLALPVILLRRDSSPTRSARPAGDASPAAVRERLRALAASPTRRPASRSRRPVTRPRSTRPCGATRTGSRTRRPASPPTSARRLSWSSRQAGQPSRWAASPGILASASSPASSSST